MCSFLTRIADPSRDHRIFAKLSNKPAVWSKQQGDDLSGQPVHKGKSNYYVKMGDLKPQVPMVSSLFHERHSKFNEHELNCLT